MWNFERTDEGYKPKTTQNLDDAIQEKIGALVESLEEDEDVEEVYTNLE